MIPLRTDYRMHRRPLVNYAIIAANIILFVMGYNGMSEQGMVKIGPWMLDPDYPRIQQFFSSVFLHASWEHLLGNMVFLWVFGNAVNDKFGQAGYAAFYLAGGVLADAGYMLMSGNAPVLGASGAISAVTGAYLVLLPKARVTLLVIFYFITTIEISSLYFLLFQFIFNMWMSLEPSFMGRGAGGVAYAAHSAGYVFGIALAAALLIARILPRDAFDLPNLLRSTRRRYQYRRVTASGYDPFSFERSRPVAARTVESAAPDTRPAREVDLRRRITEAHAANDIASAARLYLELVQTADDAALPRQQQLDVANQLMSAEQYAAAADAYERFLSRYGSFEHTPDICLMLGLLYGRYLHQYDRAEHYLTRAVNGLRDARKLAMAQGDLDALRRRGRG